MNNDDISLDFVKKQSDDHLNPMVCVFPYNYPNLSLINDPEQTTWKLAENKEKKLKWDKSLVGKNSKILYEGRNKPSNNRSDYLVAVLNKKRPRDIKIYDVDAIFQMNQKVIKISNNKILEDEEHTGTNKLELMANFGTAKAKRMAVNMKQNLVKEGNISSVKEIKNKLKQTEVSQVNEKIQEQNQLSFYQDILPEFDLTEKNEKKVFNFNTVIDNDIVRNIDHEPILNILTSEKDLKNLGNTYCEFIFEYLMKIMSKIKEGKKMFNKIKYSIYLNELIVFHLLPKKLFNSPQKISETTGINIEHLKIMLKKYTNKNESEGKSFYIKSPNLILRSIYHILCLALLLEGFEFDYSSLAKSLKIDVKDVRNYYSEMGCSFKTSLDGGEGKGNVVCFKAPLKLNLKIKDSGKRRGKR